MSLPVWDGDPRYVLWTLDPHSLQVIAFAEHKIHIALKKALLICSHRLLFPPPMAPVTMFGNLNFPKTSGCETPIDRPATRLTARSELRLQPSMTTRLQTWKPLIRPTCRSSSSLDTASCKNLIVVHHMLPLFEASPWDTHLYVV